MRSSAHALCICQTEAPSVIKRTSSANYSQATVEVQVPTLRLLKAQVGACNDEMVCAIMELEQNKLCFHVSFFLLNTFTPCFLQMQHYPVPPCSLSVHSATVHASERADVNYHEGKPYLEQRYKAKQTHRTNTQRCRTTPCHLPAVCHQQGREDAPLLYLSKQHEDTQTQHSTLTSSLPKEKLHVG